MSAPITRAMLRPPDWLLRFAIVIGMCAAVSIGSTRAASIRLPNDSPPVLQAASGTIEGTITMRSDVVRTSDRYISGSGESRDVATVPVVVFIEGRVPSAGAVQPSGLLEIAQRDETFEPAVLVVPVGARVEFPNRDPLFHNVFSYSRAKRFDLGRYRQGESKAVVFDRPGYVKVLCEVHKWMRVGVVVIENPYYAVVSEQGRFRIDGVPAGRYQMTIEHFDRRPQTVPVEVRANDTSRIDVRL